MFISAEHHPYENITKITATPMCDLEIDTKSQRYTMHTVATQT